MTSRRPAPDFPSATENRRYLQLRLFDASAYTATPVEDPLAGWSLTDVRALAVDFEPQIRLAAAASRWNVDARLQRVLAVDPDESVVLALLAHADPCVEAVELIIAGPQVSARRELARRNLRDELLEQLANDSDPVASTAARRTLARRTASRVRSDLQSYGECA